MASAPEEAAASQNIYAQVDGYQWDSDREFQGGLSAILGANPSPDQAVELALRARCFYFTRCVAPHRTPRIWPHQIWNAEQHRLPTTASEGTMLELTRAQKIQHTRRL